MASHGVARLPRRQAVCGRRPGTRDPSHRTRSRSTEQLDVRAVPAYRTHRENTVATAAGAYVDEKYLHDLIDRLKSMDRGRLNDLKSQIQNLRFAQRWGLDATGNWSSFLEDSDGNGTWDLDQTRIANRVNEIVDITEDRGPSWVAPAYNRAGNMTAIPKPAVPTLALAATFDAWNRLVRLTEGANTVARYEYDDPRELFH